MHMQDIHSCAQTLSENERLKKTLRRVKRENDEMRQKLNDFEETRKMENMLKQFVTTRNMEIQTDPPKSHLFVSHPAPVKKVDNTEQQDKLNKMLMMHNNLMKRYEKELKTNMQHVETITTLNLRINSLEQKLKEAQLNLQQSKMAAIREGKCGRKHGSSHQPQPSTSHLTSSPEDDDGPLLYRYSCVKKERDKLNKENAKLRQELKGLDLGFFEEVEDVKFALTQSVSLNQEYEKSLKKLCKQFGVPYPHPEHKVRKDQRY